MKYRKIKAYIDEDGEMHLTNGKVRVEEEGDREAVTEGLFFKGWIGRGLEDLSEKEIGLLVKVMKYVSYEDNLIVDKGEPLTKAEIAKLTGIGYERTVGIIKGLISKGIMYRHEIKVMEGYKGRRTGVYSINPYIMCRGKMIKKEICRCYREVQKKIGNFWRKKPESQ